MAEQLILAAAAASTLAPHVGQVVTVAHTVSKAVAALVHSVQVARDRHLDAQNIGFQRGSRTPSSDHDFTMSKGRARLFHGYSRTEPKFQRVHWCLLRKSWPTLQGRCDVRIEFYEVLVADESAVRWETATYPFYVRTFNGGTLVEGGHEHDGSALFLARAFYWGGTHPGKTSSYLKGADITFAGKEYVVNDFQVLVYNTTPSVPSAYIEELD
ncbi:hypothetical protein FS749_015446 [Ceratobasidium sp. UAMH 11750]|nr:hypothetical protein FS749_015446 [Ceratobasidium sp. UAMH 11750]